MSKDNTSPGGLFSKMVKFVRSPSGQWNDLDEPSSAKEGSLSKQALKEMIERKRRNDFVRKREFDMLRKLRRREATGGGSASDIERPSFFQSSLPSRPDDRAMTLKKIDEIEAQMSMQWWKTKHGAAAGVSSLTTSSDFAPSVVPSRPNSPGLSDKATKVGAASAYAKTAPDDLQNSLAHSAAKFNQFGAKDASPQSAASSVPVITTRIVSSSPPPAGMPRAPSAPDLHPAAPPASALTARDDNSLDFTSDASPNAKPLIKSTVMPASAAAPKPSFAAPAAMKPPGAFGGLGNAYDASGAVSGFSASKVFALEVGEIQHDPELEEASIRFANGDDDGAEAGLLEAVGVQGSRHQHEETWLALFDLYRATGAYSRFESLAIDFASKFGRSSPLWFSIPEMVSKMAGAEPVAPMGSRKADWKSPAVFGIQSLAALNAALARSPMPWTLDWSSLQSIDDSSVAPLYKLWLSWAGQTVQLRMAHSANLENVLRAAAPSGNRAIDQTRWQLLMAYLRMAHRPDEFELAALDFCVTYEVSPPSWEAARCDFKLLDAEGNTGVGQTIVGDAVHDSIVSELHTDVGSSMMTAQLASVELSGQIMGEPKPVLDKLEARLTGADVMIISCAKLVRVDFSAAGSLLNWVTTRQSEGRIVQFTDVHRLVAAFFHVIGISEHAKVTTRVD